jgi:hypothetical protein
VEQVWRRGEKAELRVCASPFVTRNGANGKPVRRELLRTREECRTWFCTHLKQAGCRPILERVEVGSSSAPSPGCTASDAYASGGSDATTSTKPNSLITAAVVLE